MPCSVPCSVCHAVCHADLPAVCTPKWRAYFVPPKHRQSAYVNKLDLIRFRTFHLCVFNAEGVLRAATEPNAP